MDINKHLIDQRIKNIVKENPEWFSDINDDNKKISKAFVLFTASTFLDIELTEAVSLLTDGGGDAGIDAVYIGDADDLELPVTIFQGKYKMDLETESNFPANEVQKVANTIWTIFDTNKDIKTFNLILKSKIEEIRSLIRDGYIPIVKVVLFNNGIKWNQEGEQNLINANFPKEQVEFEYVNHNSIVALMRSSKEINASFTLEGASLVDDFNFKRVLLGKINVLEIARLFEANGDFLLEKNIRRYLGLNRNRINLDMQNTLLGKNKENFYFKNNGLTMICKKFSHNALQQQNWNISAENLQIINGGQTCKTIQRTISDNPLIDYSQVFVLIRLYELSVGQNEGSLVNEITLATNSQNPVDLSDLRSNDDLQKTLEADIKELGYQYKRKKDDMKSNEALIPLSVAAQSICAIWKELPHIAKFKKKELFSSLYEKIYTSDLNAAQVVLAVLIYRYCDNQRRKNNIIEMFPHIPYSNYFISMIIGELLLEKHNISLKSLTHKNFVEIKNYFETNKDALFEAANQILISALNKFYNEDYKKLDNTRLASVFRHGDLLNYIKGKGNVSQII
ncbi:MAG: AIPR family protein [Endomicrobium sp.]|jgi:hypothetical protein|nr:AIPR family protein [Endomicrobium sp.]